jgi:hypothetical protein
MKGKREMNATKKCGRGQGKKIKKNLFTIQGNADTVGFVWPKSRQLCMTTPNPLPFVTSCEVYYCGLPFVLMLTT